MLTGALRSLNLKKCPASRMGEMYECYNSLAGPKESVQHLGQQQSFPSFISIKERQRRIAASRRQIGLCLNSSATYITLGQASLTHRRTVELVNLALQCHHVPTDILPPHSQRRRDPEFII